MAHLLWIGNSFMVVTSAGLMAHHLFGCWHGDKRLGDKYGETFEKARGLSASGAKGGPPNGAHIAGPLPNALGCCAQVKARTSIVPFQAIWEGRQKPPADWYKEFIRCVHRRSGACEQP